MYRFIFIGLFFEFFGKLNGCVFITVSSTPSNKLEVNWHCQDLESISVFERDPNQNSNLKPLTIVYPAHHPTGFYKTNITFSPEPFPGGWSKGHTGPRNVKSHCLYWTKTRFYNQLFHEGCFKIQPAWMSENKMNIKNLTLPFVFIPGTHNSGTDAMRIMKKRSVSQLNNFVLTQDQSVWNQLVYGIRFLDFRVGFYPQENENLRFWINHDLLSVQPLLPVLKDIVEFSKSSPDEVIILDFHRFPSGFKTKNSSTIHRELIQLIEREFKDMIIPRPVSQVRLSLEEIWNSDGRIIVCYSEEDFVWETSWLWSTVPQIWGNKQTPESLEKFLDNVFRNMVPTTKIWAAMAELTPTPLDFLRNVSLRSMADSVNRLLSNWFAQKQNWTSKANIVATDFFLGTNLINLAIEENIRRGKQK